jgi:HEAT repeat protein
MKVFTRRVIMCAAMSCLCLGVSARTTVAAHGGKAADPLLQRMKVVQSERRLREKGYDPADHESIKAAAADPKWPHIRSHAMELLSTRMGKQAVPILRQAVDDPSQGVRRCAARLLAGFGDKEGLARMRQDLADLTPARSAAEIDKAVDLDERQKQEANRVRTLQLHDALATAKVLAEFGDHSGYDLAIRVVKGDGDGRHRLDAVQVLWYISNTNLTVLHAGSRDPDTALLTLAQTEQEPLVVDMICGCAYEYRRPEVGIRIMETLVKSPHVSQDRREKVERALESRKLDIERAETHTTPQK